MAGEGEGGEGEGGEGEGEGEKARVRSAPFGSDKNQFWTKTFSPKEPRFNSNSSTHAL